MTVTLVTLGYIYGVRAREYVYIGRSVTSVTDVVLKKTITAFRPTILCPIG